jgi:imidazolonepropionase-like amidohydrolase
LVKGNPLEDLDGLGKVQAVFKNGEMLAKSDGFGGITS